MGIQHNLNPSPISNLNCNSLFCSQFSFMIFPFPVICSPNPYSPFPVLGTPKLQSSGLQLKAFTLPYAKGWFGHAIIKNIHVCLSHVEPRIILQYSKTHTVFYFSILQRYKSVDWRTCLGNTVGLTDSLINTMLLLLYTDIFKFQVTKSNCEVEVLL